MWSWLLYANCRDKTYAIYYIKYDESERDALAKVDKLDESLHVNGYKNSYELYRSE